MKSYSLTRCRDCGHEEVRYSNVKRCRVCHGPVERPTPAAVEARLDLAQQIVDAARMWAMHDAKLRELLRKWEA